MTLTSHLAQYRGEQSPAAVVNPYQLRNGDPTAYMTGWHTLIPGIDLQPGFTMAECAPLDAPTWLAAGSSRVFGHATRRFIGSTTVMRKGSF